MGVGADALRLLRLRAKFNASQNDRTYGQCLRTGPKLLGWRWFATGLSSRFLTIVLSVAVLRLATDTSRLLVLVLPAVVPLCAIALSESGTVRIAVGVVFAIPAVVAVIPSRFTYTLRPLPFEQVEACYSNGTDCGLGTTNSGRSRRR